MRRFVCALVIVLRLVAACDGNGGGAAPSAVLDLASEVSDCPQENAEGTVSPDITICSITYVVEGGEQVVRDRGTLHAAPWDQVRVGEVVICVGKFSGEGGQACVDFVPADRDGREIASGRSGTHMMKVTSGCRSIPGPQGVWTVGENWGYIIAVLNHWPPVRTEDRDCANGACERDDRIMANLR